MDASVEVRQSGGVTDTDSHPTIDSSVLRLSAFDLDGSGGNPAGVVLDAAGMTQEQMQRIAAEVGYSETAFLETDPGGELRIRYFSPLAEVDFCGHATIATAVAHAERVGAGDIVLHTAAGEVAVRTAEQGGRMTATLTSVAPSVEDVDAEALDAALAALNWSAADLDPTLPPRVAYAGARHLVLAAARRERLADLRYELPVLGAVMQREHWTTVHLIWRAGPAEFHARDPFPPGGVYEDAATGAAAAAFGAYLRELQLVPTPGRVTILQGQDMGRPSRLLVDIPEDRAAGISVSGTATPIAAPSA